MKWLGWIVGPTAAAPIERREKLTDIIARLPAADASTERDVRIVKDMVRHVMPQLVEVLKRHGRTMETPAQVQCVWLEATVQLGLEAALGIGFAAAAEPGARREASAGALSDALDLMIGGFNDHRDELLAQAEAVRLGVRGGQVRKL